ncbi:MAG: hypothetical protein D3925_01785 [Candidatus Electrothrix sp. AR5]|nr:hypothetical protein [Candidatus Electrothrix sp. AR5]
MLYLLHCFRYRALLFPGKVDGIEQKKHFFQKRKKLLVENFLQNRGRKKKNPFLGSPLKKELKKMLIDKCPKMRLIIKFKFSAFIVQTLFYVEQSPCVNKIIKMTL